MEYDKLKNKVRNYYSTYENTKNKIEKFKHTLDKIADHELPKRDNEQFFQIRDFTNTFVWVYVTMMLDPFC
ncbi:hypothetical protein AU377_14300 [Sporosarcina sp. HYO08]|nr:hypothetical protein AU377_14300 [Sporosarcina sp. HYO08]